MSITIRLPSEIEQRIKDAAARDGLAVEDYVLTILSRKSEGLGANAAPALKLTAEEFERLLDEFSDRAPLAELPTDFSRIDIYSDHD